MLTLKKLFYPQVQDICPNCGEACAITDVLCPKCGKNLDELFENLSNSDVIYKPNWFARLLANPQVIKAWNIANSIVLVVSLFAPWIVFFSDVVVVKFQFEYVIGFRVLLFPLSALISQQISPMAEFLPAFIWILVEAVALAIAIYYSVYGIRTALQMRTEANTPARKYSHAIFRLLFAFVSLALIKYGVGFNSFVSFGYILAVIGLSSAFLLELGVPVLGRKQLGRKAA